MRLSPKSLWLMWGALTDWVENKPEEQPQAEAFMLRAAREWLALGEEKYALTAYFDRCLCDELGYALCM